MPYTPVDIRRNRLKASAAPKFFKAKPQNDDLLRIYTLELEDDGSPEYSKRVSFDMSDMLIEWPGMTGSGVVCVGSDWQVGFD